jgi:hypothetical protein
MAALVSESGLMDTDNNLFITKCLNFYEELATQIYKRFPFASDHVQCLNYMDFIDPKNISSTISISSIVPFLKIN